MIVPLNPPVRILLGPGPSDIHPRVLEALAKPTVGHLDPYYLEIMNGMQQMLREVFRTKNEMTMAISGTGSAGMEAAVVNVIEPGDSMIVCVNGVFGGRMVDVAERAGANVTKVERPWGEVFTPADLKDALAKAKPKVVGIVMAETSTGARQPLEEISKLVHDAGALLLGRYRHGARRHSGRSRQVAARYRLLRHAKVPQLPAGLGPDHVRPARDGKNSAPARPKVQSWYLDVTMLSQYWGQERVYHHTAPINMTYGLYEALSIVLEEGLDNCFARHAPTSRRAESRPGGDRHRLLGPRRPSTCRCSTP